MTSSTGLEARLAVALGAFKLDVAIDVPEGETLALLGPNGSGKTTCLDLIAGLRAPDAGSIRLGETVFVDTGAGVDLPPEARRVGLVFQDFALFPHRTVRGNVAYGPGARGLAAAARARAVNENLERFDLLALADRAVSGLSGGQRQRVALARALASDARILLLDEPFAALDTTLRARMRAELRGFLRDSGLPALVVTHDPLDAFVLGDRLAVLERGVVVQSGPPEEILAHPRTAFVADLAGLNVYNAEIAAGSGLKPARAGAAVFQVLADDLAGAVHLAFAPSDVALAAERTAGSFQNTFEVRVMDTLALPDRLRVLLDAGVPMTADITRQAGERLPLAPGSPLWAMVKATSIRVYP